MSDKSDVVPFELLDVKVFPMNAISVYLGFKKLLR